MITPSELGLNELTIHKLIDFILLNSSSVNSSGLYNGKAGISLTLFEVSRYFQNEYIEEEAFNLLQEALLSKNEGISFENGLSGIGFVLFYLIENKFINADFSELFGDNLRKITVTLTEWAENNSYANLFNNINIVYLLQAIHEKHKHQNFSSLILTLIGVSTNLMEEKFVKTKNSIVDVSKINILHSFKQYLKIIDMCNFLKLSRNIIDMYMELYRQNVFMSDYAIGFYLDFISRKLTNYEMKEVAMNNKVASIRNIYPKALSLSQRIELLYQISFKENNNSILVEFLEKGFYNSTNEPLLEKNILGCLDYSALIIGYYSGISRYLLYWLYRNNKDKNIDCSRFNILF